MALTVVQERLHHKTQKFFEMSDSGNADLSLERPGRGGKWALSTSGPLLNSNSIKLLLLILIFTAA